MERIGGQVGERVVELVGGRDKEKNPLSERGDKANCFLLKNEHKKISTQIKMPHKTLRGIFCEHILK